METVAQISHITKSFTVGIQDVLILKDISFTLKKGDFTIIFGPSGCGKSTLLHTLLGLEPPTTGTIDVFGTRLYGGLSEDDMSEFRKKTIGMVYQQPNWILSLSVLENVEFPLLLAGGEDTNGMSRATTLLDSLQMLKWAHYLPTELSSGQQQKIALARALITDPPLIIADEPTGNLDFTSGQELMQILSSINKEGKTIVMVTHDLEYTKYAKNIIERFDGKIVRIYDEHSKHELFKRNELKRGETQDFKADAQKEKTQ